MDPSLELQAAIVARLKGDAALSALIGERVYDHVPRNPDGKVDAARFPYVSFGPEQVLPDGWDCQESSELFLQIDAWSRGVGFPEVKKIADAVRRALHDEDLQLSVNALVCLEFESRRVMRDPDGATSHAALTFRAIIEHD